MVSTMSIYIGTCATRERGNEVQMFLFNRMNKRIQTGNNGRGPGGPRLPSHRRSSGTDDRWLNVPTAGMAPDDQRQEWGRLVDGKNSIGHCG